MQVCNPFLHLFSSFYVVLLKIFILCISCYDDSCLIELVIYQRESASESERAQAGGAAGRGRSRLPTEEGAQVGLDLRTLGS